MNADSVDTSVPQRPRSGRASELFAFLVLSVLIWPIIAVGVVASWGLVVWMHHAFIGLPGPGH
jgi:nitrate reductase NapE